MGLLIMLIVPRLRRSGSYYSLFNVTLKLAMSFDAGAAHGCWPTPALSRARASRPAALDAVRLIYAMPACCCGLMGVLLLIAPARQHPSEQRSKGPVLT
jgi:hypothetical protein